MVAWMNSLPGAAWLFVGAWSVHTLDHVRRGVDASPEAVVWSGTMVGLLACVCVTLIITRHAAAPALSLVAFPSIAIGVLASHIPPKWGALSDPILFDSATDAWSVPAVTVEVVAALWLGIVAFGIVSRRGYALSIEAEDWVAPDFAAVS